MYINEAYLNNSREDFKDKSKPLIVCNAGMYRLDCDECRLPTLRPKGREDYQLIYVSEGKGYFHFDSDQNETIIEGGHMVLFRPHEFQKYEYYGTDRTEVFWVHFTGGDVKNILRGYGFEDDKKVYGTGNSPEFGRIYQRMIMELQGCKEKYKDYLVLLLTELFINVERQLLYSPLLPGKWMDGSIEKAVRYFNEHYNQEINISEFAEEQNMSVSWFIRGFKQHMGVTPMQYILSLRISNAQNLLTSTDYNMTEISSFVGYDNPLYFSRIFKKQVGCSPTEWKKRQETER